MEINLPRTEDGVVPSVICLIGPRGSGKTFMAATIVPMLVAKKSQITSAGPVAALSIRLGVPHHNISPLRPDEANKFFTNELNSREHHILVVDECDSFMSAGGYTSQALTEYARVGRNYGLGLVSISHSTAETAKSLLNHADIQFWFRQSLPGATEYIHKYIDPDMPGSSDAIRNMPERTAFVWLPNSTPKFGGYARVIDGQVVIWNPEEESEEQAEPVEPEPTPDPEPAPEAAPEPTPYNHDTSEESK
jgi:hypothetical protein